MSRLEPVIRARQATGDVKRRSLLDQRSSSTVGDTARGELASAPSVVKAAGRAGTRRGACRSNPSKRCARSEVDRSERRENRRSPLANQAARTDLDRAGSHTGR